MDLLASLLVGKPQSILAVAIVFLAGYFTLRSSALRIGRRARPLLIASIAWGLYAAWEWLVLVKTPEADIRMDLLLIWPVLALLSAWALLRALR